MVDSSNDELVFENSSADEDEEVFSEYGNEEDRNEYSSRELEAMKFDCSEDMDSSEENESDFSRLENLHWCTCEKCLIIPTLMESKCCCECRSLLNENLAGVKCITLNKDFIILCIYQQNSSKHRSSSTLALSKKVQTC